MGNNDKNNFKFFRNSILGVILGLGVVGAAAATTEDRVLSTGGLVTTSVGDRSCHSRILNGEDSAFVRISNQEESLVNEAKARSRVEIVRRHFECRDGELAIQSVVCMRGLEPVFSTDLCRVNTEEGYFLILQDYRGGFNVLFNRWD